VVEAEIILEVEAVVNMRHGLFMIMVFVV
jgi:hypothetical protein